MTGSTCDTTGNARARSVTFDVVFDTCRDALEKVQGTAPGEKEICEGHYSKKINWVTVDVELLRVFRVSPIGLPHFMQADAWSHSMQAISAMLCLLSLAVASSHTTGQSTE